MVFSRPRGLRASMRYPVLSGSPLRADFHTTTNATMTQECFVSPRKVLLLIVPGGFYWSVPRESWCSFPFVFLHREQWSVLRLCSVTTETQAEWILYLRLAVSQSSSREVVSATEVMWLFRIYIFSSLRAVPRGPQIVFELSFCRPE